MAVLGRADLVRTALFDTDVEEFVTRDQRPRIPQPDRNERQSSLFPFRRWRKAPGVIRGPIWWLWFRLTRRYPCSDEFLYRAWAKRQLRECICTEHTSFAMCPQHGWWYRHERN